MKTSKLRTLEPNELRNTDGGFLPLFIFGVKITAGGVAKFVAGAAAAGAIAHFAQGCSDTNQCDE